MTNKRKPPKKPFNKKAKSNRPAKRKTPPKAGVIAALVGLAGAGIGAGYLAIRSFEEKERKREEAERAARKQREKRPPKGGKIKF